MCIVSHQGAVHYWTKPVEANEVAAVTRPESPRSCENGEKACRAQRAERETHDAVRRRGAADEALDLALLPVRSLVCLGAGDGRRPWRYKEQTCSNIEHQTHIDQHGQQQNLGFFSTLDVWSTKFPWASWVWIMMSWESRLSSTRVLKCHLGNRSHNIKPDWTKKNSQLYQ